MSTDNNDNNNTDTASVLDNSTEEQVQQQPQPDPVPEPTPEPVPDPEPTPEPTPEPDPVPEPEPVPDPTPDPVPDPVPDPTPVPDPEPTPDPTPEPEPTPEPVPDPVVVDNVDNDPTTIPNAAVDEQQTEDNSQPVTLQSMVEELTTATTGIADDDLIPGPGIMTSIVANMYVKQQIFEYVGSTSTVHTYAYDHLLLLAQGKLQLWVNSQYTEFTAPKMIYIQAGLPHQLTALTESVLTYSIHGLRNSAVSDDIVDPSQVPNGVDLLVKNILKLN